MNRRRWIVLVLSLTSLPALSYPDQVIMKDGTVYKGKIQIDTDKAILIGNPPLDPTSYLLKTQDIEKIIYEPYHPAPPSETKRGLIFEAQLGGRTFSSNELDLHPTAGLYLGMGFRVHPLVELSAGFDWMPALESKDDFAVSNGTTTRRYEHFAQYGAGFSLRLYPLYQKHWKTEPYVTAGYQWASLAPNASGDSFKGAGWNAGAGLIHPLTTHLYLEARLSYQNLTFDQIHFLGRQSGINPTIQERMMSVQVGASYRM